MNVGENPINLSGLATAKMLTGGHKGVVFLLATATEKVVLKFQTQPSVEPLAGTRILLRAGVTTPAVRTASTKEVASIEAAIKKLGNLNGLESEFAKAKKLEPCNVLLMDFVEGTVLREAREGNLTNWLWVLMSFEFAYELGKIVAADAFSGNSDRFMGAYKGFNMTDVKGFYNQENTFVRNCRPIAIDNSFAPTMVPSLQKNGWGRHADGGTQLGSLVSASEDLARDEAGHIYDTLIETTMEKWKDNAINQQVITMTMTTHRNHFCNYFVQGASAAMQALLGRGQSWKKQFVQDNISTKMMTAFKTRKRTLRLMAANGKNLTEEGKKNLFQASLKTAQSDQAYREWVLKTELGYNDEEVQGILNDLGMALTRYKAAKASGPKSARV